MKNDYYYKFWPFKCAKNAAPFEAVLLREGQNQGWAFLGTKPLGSRPFFKYVNSGHGNLPWINNDWHVADSIDWLGFMCPHCDSWSRNKPYTWLFCGSCRSYVCPSAFEGKHWRCCPDCTSSGHVSELTNRNLSEFCEQVHYQGPRTVEFGKTFKDGQVLNGIAHLAIQRREESCGVVGGVSDRQLGRPKNTDLSSVCCSDSIIAPQKSQTRAASPPDRASLIKADPPAIQLGYSPRSKKQ